MMFLMLLTTATTFAIFFYSYLKPRRDCMFIDEKSLLFIRPCRGRTQGTQLFYKQLTLSGS